MTTDGYIDLEIEIGKIGRNGGEDKKKQTNRVCTFTLRLAWYLEISNISNCS